MLLRDHKENIFKYYIVFIYFLKLCFSGPSAVQTHVVHSSTVLGLEAVNHGTVIRKYMGETNGR